MTWFELTSSLVLRHTDFFLCSLSPLRLFLFGTTYLLMPPCYYCPEDQCATADADAGFTIASTTAVAATLLPQSWCMVGCLACPFFSPTAYSIISFLKYLIDTPTLLSSYCVHALHSFTHSLSENASNDCDNNYCTPAIIIPITSQYLLATVEKQ